MPFIALAYPAAVAGAKAIGVRIASSAAARGIQQGVRYAMSPQGEQVIKQGVKNVLGHQRVQQAKRGIKKAAQAIGSFYERNEKKMDFIQEIMEQIAENGWDAFAQSFIDFGKHAMVSSKASIRAWQNSVRNYKAPKTSHALSVHQAPRVRPNSYRPGNGGFMPM